jgi:putative flavoprotein involved in K+ transport
MTIVPFALFTSTAALQAAPQVQLSIRQAPRARAAVSMVKLPIKLPGLPFTNDDTAELAAAAHDVVIVGAGAAGVGCAMMLTKTFGLDPSRVLLLERGDAIGESFRRWPAEMRFISPSFNQQGWTASMDLNSIARGSSPAFLFHTEHPSGKEYADYLTVCANAFDLNVRTATEVVSIEPKGKPGGPPLFRVTTRPSKSADQEGGQESATETLGARYVVWAAGEFQYPDQDPDELPGAELCVHNSQVESWARLPGDDFVVIGGYESGADAAINLAKAGKPSTVLASTATWDSWAMDPSVELAPYTAARLREVTAPGLAHPPPKP